jgi:hypothetical protein
MKRAKRMKRVIAPQLMYKFIESQMGAKLMPWQRDLVETFTRAAAAGRRVVFMPARRNGMVTVRKVCEALRVVNGRGGV